MKNYRVEVLGELGHVAIKTYLAKDEEDLRKNFKVLFPRLKILRIIKKWQILLNSG